MPGWLAFALAVILGLLLAAAVIIVGVSVMIAISY